MRRISWLLGAACLLASTACNAYRLEPPTGFAVVTEYDELMRMKAGDNVGLNVKVFENVDGGTLAFWGEDLVRKLSARQYTLLAHKPVSSKNGMTGTRFDFAYESREGAPKFYSVALFITDKYRVVIELAGDEEHRARYLARMDGIAKATTVRGCKVGKDLCSVKEQPKVAIAAVPEPEAGAGDGDEPAVGEEPAEATTTPEASDEPAEPVETASK